MALVGRCGRVCSQMPITQGSSRPVLVVRDSVATLRAPPRFMPLPLLQRQRGRDEEREKCLLLLPYLLANSIPPSLPTPPPSLTLTSSSSSSLTKQHLLWTACSVLWPKKLPTFTIFPVVGKVTACCSAHPLKPIVNSSIRLPPPRCEHTEACTNTRATSWQPKHMQSRPHSQLSPPVSYTNRQKAEICSFSA